jgi:hypothetical protein
MTAFQGFRELDPLRDALARHPVYAQVTGVAELRLFMAHHVFPVWDFMSLVKYLQGVVAPATVPWIPRGDPAVRRFINEIVMEEESDAGMPGAPGEAGFTSHFELYCEAMRELGGDPVPAERFVRLVEQQGVPAALGVGLIPEPAREFVRSTFAVIAGGKPHEVAAAFSLGREQVIPPMFRALLGRLGVDRGTAPAFHYYLERHIHLDEGAHAPLALRLLENLCAGDPVRISEASMAARVALRARIRFWDGVSAAIADLAGVAA